MESTRNRLSKNRSVARACRGNLRYIVACRVLGSNSLTRYLGMPPNGEIAIPVYKNIPQALGVNGFEILKRGSFRRNASAPVIPSIENGAGLSPLRRLCGRNL